MKYKFCSKLPTGERIHIGRTSEGNMAARSDS
jgi:hypothetical protein